ncbi:PBECR2 nuclease fold domain-containing protein [Neobacillus drentensis]|uniref:PBECR3 domain-containing polyvalent protein n=1 Tax=Neobacillus drentensis TaxID=220684 RepID=UPI002FFE7278
MKPEKVGQISEIVISILNLSVDPDAPIFLGETNLEHMKKEHPDDFEKYRGKIAEILEEPDYVAKHPKKDSIEYIKKYYDEQKKDYVLVAVRATTNGIHFAKTLFVMADRKVEKYKAKGAFKEIKKP